jgi:hypothetical protein
MSAQERAREQFPSVLLALLGIIQALALELLWERGIGGLERWRAIDAAASGALQVAAVFLGVIDLWLAYVTLVLRFRWLPRFRDLVLPFAFGALEFLVIALMAPDLLAWWFIGMAAIFACAGSMTFATFQVAARQGERPAGASAREQLLSFLPSAVITALFVLCALLAWRVGPASYAATGALGIANLGLFAQMLVLRRYWYADMAAP